MAGEAQENALLVEGARSYPKALLALATFCQQVQGICPEALNRNATELEAALGLPFQAAEPKDWVWPKALDSGEINGTDACRGAWIVCRTKVKCELWN